MVDIVSELQRRKDSYERVAKSARTRAHIDAELGFEGFSAFSSGEYSAYSCIVDDLAQLLMRMISEGYK